MRPHLVVMLPPVFDDDLGFQTVPEPLHRQAFIPELPIEAFRRAVLPRLAGINQRAFYPSFRHPLQERSADKLRTIVATQVTRRTAHADEPGQYVDDPPGADRSCHVDGECFPRVLIHYSQALDLLSIGASIEDEVNGRGRLAATLRLGRFLGTCKPCSAHTRLHRALPISMPSRPRNTRMRREP